MEFKIMLPYLVIDYLFVHVVIRTLTSLLSSRIFWYRRSASFIIVAPAFSFMNGQIGVEAFSFT